MNSYTIVSPSGTFAGKMHGVEFSRGEAHVALNDADAEWFRQRRYRVIADVAGVGDGPSYKDLQAEAKTLAIPASGTKDELAKAIAAEKARLAQLPQDTAGAPQTSDVAGPS